MSRIIRKKLETYLENFRCLKCEKGIMERDGSIVLTTDPPQYPHKCNYCGEKENFPESLPRLVYNQID